MSEPRKRFGVETRNPDASGIMVMLREWRLWKWYVTEKRRDQALMNLRKSLCNAYDNVLAKAKPEYRAVDR